MNRFFLAYIFKVIKNRRNKVSKQSEIKDELFLILADKN